MICPSSGIECPRVPCPGTTDPGICQHWQALDRHRRGVPPETILRTPNRTGRPRVGILAPCLNSGGAESWQLALVAATAGRVEWQGIAVALPEEAASLAALATARERLPVAFGADAIRELAGRCEVLISWMVQDLEPFLVGVEPRPKIVYVDHFPHDEVYDEATRWCLRSVDHLVGVSQLCSPGFPPEFAGRTSTIGNAVDPAKLIRHRDPAEVRRSWGVPAGAKIAGYYSRIAPEKRPDAMFRLVGSLPPDWSVVLVGDCRSRPDERRRLEAMLAALPGADRVLFWHGPDPGAADVLGAFTVLVVPAEVESFGLTMAEGLALGVPVVSTPVGLAKIRPGLTYPIRLDAPGDELAAAVLAAATGGPREGSRDFVLDRAGMDRFGRRWAGLIERLAGPATADARTWMSVDLCEHGQSGPCGCGTGPPRVCTRDGGRRAVRRDPDCFECRRAEEAIPC